MSLRSQRSTQSRRVHRPDEPVDDVAVYTAALKVAILEYVLQHKRTVAAANAAALARTHDNGVNASIPAGAALATRQEGGSKRESLRRSITEGSWSTGFTSVAWGDLFRGEARAGAGGSNSSPRYPERFVKVLRQRLEDISKGADPRYGDMMLRYTVGVFYGKFEDTKNARIFRDTRKLEDLMMIFIATATDVLKKRCTGDEWKIRLEEQVEQFAQICEDGLRNKEVKHVPPELFTKLQVIRERISGNRAQVNSAATLRPAAASESERGKLPPAPAPLTFDVFDMPLAMQVGRVFGKDPDQLQADINGSKRSCNERVSVRSDPLGGALP